MSTGGNGTLPCWGRYLDTGVIQYCFGMGTCLPTGYCDCAEWAWEADGIRSTFADDATRQCRYNLREVTGATFTGIQVYVATFNFCLVAATIYGLVLIAQGNKLKLNLQTLAMISIFIYTGMSGICWVLDPLYALQQQNVVPLKLNQVLHTLPDSFVASAYVVVLFYLRDLAAAKLHRASRFAQGRYVAIGASISWAFLFLVALLSCLDVIGGVTYAAVFFFFFLFFGIYFYRQCKLLLASLLTVQSGGTHVTPSHHHHSGISSARGPAAGLGGNPSTPKQQPLSINNVANNKDNVTSPNAFNGVRSIASIAPQQDIPLPPTQQNWITSTPTTAVSGNGDNQASADSLARTYHHTNGNGSGNTGNSGNSSTNHTHTSNGNGDTLITVEPITNLSVNGTNGSNSKVGSPTNSTKPLLSTSIASPTAGAATGIPCDGPATTSSSTTPVHHQQQPSSVKISTPANNGGTTAVASTALSTIPEMLSPNAAAAAAGLPATHIKASTPDTSVLRKLTRLAIGNTVCSALLVTIFIIYALYIVVTPLHALPHIILICMIRTAAQSWAGLLILTFLPPRPTRSRHQTHSITAK